MTSTDTKTRQSTGPEATPDGVDTATPPGGITPEAAPPVQHRGRQGFLPIRTNTFDRVFISVVVFVAINLLWMRFLEAFLPLWAATIISIVLGVLIVKRG